MGLLDRLTALFGATEKKQPAPTPATTDTYQGFLITALPIKKGNLYRVAATISKGKRSHQLIRADEMSNEQECIALSLRKARLMIDQQGEKIF